MEYRQLGRTGLDVSVVGLGLEYLNGQPRDTVVETIHTAIDAGVNYFDVIFSLPDYLDNMRAAFAGQRNRVLLTGHLGSLHKNGQYMRHRDPKKNEAGFLSFGPPANRLCRCALFAQLQHRRRLQKNLQTRRYP